MRRRDERGLSLSVWAAVALPAFIVAVGIGVDFAGHAAAEQEARIVAGQAARVALQEVSLQEDGPVLDPVAGQRAAVVFAESVGYSAQVHVTANERVSVSLSGQHRTTFLGLIGVPALGVEAESSAQGLSQYGS